MHAHSRKEDGEDRGAVLILPLDPVTGDTVLVMDPYKANPRYKIAGGGIKNIDVDAEHPLDEVAMATTAAKRELEEETGLPTEKDQIMLVARINKKTHFQYVFVALADFQHLKPYGRDGEKTLRIHPDKIPELKDFLECHVNILNMITGAIRPKKP